MLQQGEQYQKQIVASNKVKEAMYILEAKVQTWVWEEETCSAKKEVYNFRKATTQEIQRYRQRSLPADVVIPHDG